MGPAPQQPWRELDFAVRHYKSLMEIAPGFPTTELAEDYLTTTLAGLIPRLRVDGATAALALFATRQRLPPTMKEVRPVLWVASNRFVTWADGAALEKEGRVAFLLLSHPAQADAAVPETPSWQVAWDLWARQLVRPLSRSLMRPSFEVFDPQEGTDDHGQQLLAALQHYRDDQSRQYARTARFDGMAPPPAAPAGGPGAPGPG